MRQSLHLNEENIIGRFMVWQRHIGSANKVPTTSVFLRGLQNDQDRDSIKEILREIERPLGEFVGNQVYRAIEDVAAYVFNRL